ARQVEPLVDIPQNHRETARVPDNSLGEASHLESPLPGSQAKMGRNNPDCSMVNGDIDVECASGLAWWDTQIDTADREDRVTGEERDAIGASRGDERCARP